MKSGTETGDKIGNNKIGDEVLFRPAESKNMAAAFSQTAMTCPNCGGRLEGRKCKLLCTRAGCGYMVTCSEW